MGFGFAVLRLGPRDFWTMTPRELAAAMEAVAGRSETLGRARLGELMDAFPDTTHG